MKRFCNFLLITFGAYLCLMAIPQTLNYQGKLLDTTGVGIDGTLNMTFRLYSSESGGTHIWEKTIPNVSISKGLFSVELKDFPDSVNFINGYYLEIQAGTETLTPREKLSSSAYSIRANTVEHAIQSVHTSENPAERTGRMVFRAGDGVTLSDTGDSIKIIFEGVSGGSSGTGAVTGIIGGAGLSPDDSTAGLVTIDTKYDNTTIGLRNDSLYVKSIDSTQITNGGISRNDLSTTLLTDLDDAVTLGGHPASDFSGSGITGSYIQNQSDSTQTANFRISGNGIFSGNVGIGTTTPAGRLEITGYSGDYSVNNIIVGNAGRRKYFRAAAASPYDILDISSEGNTGGWYGAIDFRTSYNGGALSSVMRINGSNVGLGTTTPGTKLHIVTSSSNAQLKLERTTDYAGSCLLYTNSLAALAVQNSSASEVLWISQGGNTGIGTTSPGAKLSVSDNTTTGTPFAFESITISSPGASIVGSFVNSTEASGTSNTGDALFRIGITNEATRPCILTSMLDEGVEQAMLKFKQRMEPTLL